MDNIATEYHRFGPWLLEINADLDIPPQYSDKNDLILSAKYSFKVPVNKDRIQMKPGMLLYEYVISIFADKLIIFHIHNQSVQQSSILFKEIQYIVQGGELLRNYIQIATPEKIHTFPYHSVSHEVTSKVVTMLRSGMLNDAKPSSFTALEEDKLKHLSLYKYLMAKRVIDESANIVAYQPYQKIKLNKSEKWSWWINLFRRNKLPELLIVSKNKELIIASSDIEKKSKETVDYSHRHIFISIDKILDIKITNSERFIDVNNLTFIIGDNKIVLNVMKDFDRKRLLLLASK